VNTMKKKLVLPKLPSSRRPQALLQDSSDRNKGQATVEFTLVFMLLLIIAWIPADFGLAYLSGQIASNAAREGARIGSATPSPFDSTAIADVATETCRRLSVAFLTDPGAAGGDTKCTASSNARVLVALVPGSGACNQMVQVRVRGSYNFFFYQLLNFIKVQSDLNATLITRETRMRWEHQC